MFGRYKVTLNRVHDKVIVHEGNDKIILTVNADSMRMVAGLTAAQAKLKAITDETPDDEVKSAGKYFATVIFGKEQAEKLMEFYADDPASVIAVCGQYFKGRLADKITKVQKKLKL